ncbi:MAG: DUF58 domain-containing protein [Planctomycetes bacterium]|nr:DUF58 domain-containing protein [Planctomycetota bacterium]
MAEVSKYLDPKVLNRITRLELKARQIVEGFVAGMHKSPYHGFSVEFAAHREYTAGDDIKHLDWKVFGRSDRLYIKEYELETNLRSHILVDCSESMDYRSAESSKFELACTIAASMAHLTLRQQDAVGLVTFDKEVKSIIPSHSGRGQMHSILGMLGLAGAKNKTDLSTVFHALAERFDKKGLVIVISDLFDDPDKLIKALQHFRHRRQDLIVFHVLDEYEVTFPFQRMTLFEGLEEYPKILVDPRALRQAYLEELEKFCSKIRRGCVQSQIDYVQVTSDKPLEVELTRYLASRLAMGKR